MAVFCGDFTRDNGGEHAIPGTHRPSSIGGFVSSGRIRMYNNDIRELYRLRRPGPR